ncbi:hypothetical protein VIGAN_07202000 [Vigna angularis var. angularis]|uniref:Uncharacterized protein n=2 Tax=Phaseolus angularis TaxID=3914 RepID=A0A0S3SJT4_PHAAN|nr:hypothetical protein VIGAN_07202000 [Vigna angularis var. angularis]
MNILDSSPALKQLAEDTAFTSRNSRRKSVLHLAIEKGYRDIVDDLLTRVIHRYKENILTDDGIFYYPQVRFAVSDLPHQKKFILLFLGSQFREPVGTFLQKQ